MDVKVTGLQALEAKFARLPPSVQIALREANEANARDFMQKVAAIVPVDDDAGGHLVSTLEKTAGDKPGGVRVSIGGPEAPYPAHLEYGHMDRGGGHVPAKPFWWTTWRVNKRLFQGRASRAASKALKALAVSAAP